MSIKKRFFAIALSFFTVLMVFTPVKADNEDGIFNILARDYMAGGEGDAFHDSENVELIEKKPEYWAHGGIMLRASEWVNYELPENMREGTYIIYATIANNYDAKVSLKIDGKYIVKNTPVPKTVGPNGENDGSWQYFTKREICQVYITEASQVLTFAYAESPVTYKDITLYYLSENDFSGDVYRVYSEEFLSGGEGIGFHDNGGKHRDNTVNCAEVFHLGDIMLREGEWCAYGINVSKKGTYNVKINAANHGKVKLYAGANGLNSKPVEIQGSLSPDGAADSDWKYYTERNLGNVVLKEGYNEIRITSSAAVTFTDFTLTYVSENIEYRVPYESLYSCVNNGVSGSDNLSSPEIGKISDANNILPYKLLIMRQKSSFIFDVSSFENGSYSLSMISASSQDQIADIYAMQNETDTGMKIAHSYILPKTGSWTAYKESKDIFRFYLPENTKFIKFEIITGANQLDYFVFTKISENALNHKIPYYRTASTVAGEGFYAGKVQNSAGVSVNRETFEEPVLKYDKLAAAMRKDYFMVYDVSYLPEGVYDLTVFGATYAENTKIGIEVNGENISGENILSVSGEHADLYKYTELTPVFSVTLPKGNKTIKITALNNAFNLRHIELSCNGFLPPSFAVYNDKGEIINSVTEGIMRAFVNVNDFYSSEELMFIFAIYEENSNGTKKLYKLGVSQSDSERLYESTIEDIELDENMRYTYKLFILNKSSLNGYSYGYN